MILSFWSPLGIALLNGLLTRSTIELHHGTLTFLSGRFIMDLIVEMLKNRVGRLRPDFLDRCKWDAAISACTGNAEKVRDGRRSFPSGHSSSAFTGLGFVALLLAHKLLAAPTGSGLVASRLARISIVFAPLVLAGWIAVSRVEDYRHHVEDVFAGSLIGSLCILGTWHIYWPSPFRSRKARAAATVQGPRRVYGTRDREMTRDGFELTRLEFEDDDGPGGRV
ncbi:PAP2-domain-containing protein [Auricularia subglabra TFB-10046 SS5]|nr:PAP2-domain-containing protein [Auricularia subglabra TFB-10046 SS5]